MDESVTVQFQNVSFSYPTRPAVKVLKDINLTLTPGKIVALVGISGSMCILVQRFYDPTEGKILINGIDLKQIDLKWISRYRLVQCHMSLVCSPLPYVRIFLMARLNRKI